MSVMVRVSNNDTDQLVLVQARRTEGSSDAGSVNRYRVDAWARADDSGDLMHQVVTNAEVNHRYSDGPTLLAWWMLSETPEGRERLSRHEFNAQWGAWHGVKARIQASEHADSPLAVELLAHLDDLLARRWARS